MARLNIEDTIDADPRFRRLVRLLGDDDKALGLLVRFWRLAQQYWGRGLLVPEEEVFLDGFEPILQVGLAEQRDEGIYARGSEERFAWYRQKCDFAARGVEARQRNAREKNERKTPQKQDEQGSQGVFDVEKEEQESGVQLTGIQNPVNPLTLTLSLTNNTKELKCRKSASPPLVTTEEKNTGLPAVKPKTKSVTRGVDTSKFIARYVEEFERRYETRPALDRIAVGEAKRIVEGLGLGKSLDAVAAYLQLNDKKYLAKCHDLTSMRCDLNRVCVALDKGVEDPNKNAEWDRFAQDFKNRTEEGEGESDGQG